MIDQQTQNQNPIDNQNVVQPFVDNNNNQLVDQAKDPNLYDTMKKVIEKSKEKEQFDKKKEDEEDKMGEEKQSLLSGGGGKRKIDYKRLDEEFKDIFNKENSNINSIRRWLNHIIIFVAVMNAIVWEVDCLYLNACYGEDTEMVKWISHILCPMIIISILLLYFLYSTINYLKKIAFMICAVLYLIISILAIVISIFSFVHAFVDIDKYVESNITKLTPFELDYYENNRKKYTETEYLRYLFKLKMFITGLFDIILGFLGIIIFICSLVFNSLLSQTTFDWRPPLRSHVRISRIKKAIELYTQNSDNFVKLFRAENPHYQLDEFDNKDVNRFGAIKGMKGSDSGELSKDKKDVSNINNSGNINNIINNEEDIVLPKADTRKKEEKKEEEKKDDVNNNVNENDINTNTNQINNNINNEEEINTNINQIENHKDNNDDI